LFSCLQDIAPTNDRPTKKASAKLHPGGMRRSVEKPPAPSGCIPPECIPSMLSQCAAKRASKVVEGCIPDGMQWRTMGRSTERCIPPGCNTDRNAARRRCQNTDATRGAGLLRRFAPRNDERFSEKKLS
jgi:hypothetical protein